MGQGTSTDTGAADRRTPSRWVVAALSVVTVLWLAAQVYAGWTNNNWSYPVTGFAMFSGDHDGVVERSQLRATLATGESVVVEGADLGLNDLQLDRYVRRRIGIHADALHPGARDRLAHLAADWSRRQQATVTELTLYRETLRLASPRDPDHSEVLTWRP